MQSRLIRIYNFLTGRWHIPLDPGHYLDLLVLLALGVVFALFATWQGGMSASSLAWGSRVFAIGAAFHLFVLYLRSSNGFGIRPAGLIFLPWLLWLVVGAVFVSPKGWIAEEHLIASLLVAGTFYITLYHLRHPWLSWILGGLLVACISVLASVAIGNQGYIVESLLARKIPAIYEGMFSSTLAHPAAMGAVLLMAFFPTLVIALGRRWAFWQRMLATYFAVILAIGIWSTHHLGVWLGFLVGLPLACALTIPGKLPRFVLMLIALSTFAWTLPTVQRDIGVLRQMENAEGLPTGERPLLRAAGKTFLSAPIMGVGTGGFSLAFEQTRPAGWQTTPASAGSLPLAVLTEHGLVGALLLFGPALWIWIVSLSTCLKVPMLEKSEKSQTAIMGIKRKNGRKVIRKVKAHEMVSEERYFFGGILSGTAATGILLTLDYPGMVPAVACLLAINAALLLRVTSDRVIPVKLTAWPRRGLALGIILLPAFWLGWVLAPLTASSLVQRADDELRELLPAPEDPAPGYRAPHDPYQLDAAHRDAQAATRLNPLNGEAWHLSNLTSLRLYTVTPDQGESLARIALHASQKALERTPDEPRYLSARGAALFMCGQREDAIAHFRKAAEHAPNNLPVLLMLAEVLSQQGDTRPEALTILKKAGEMFPHNDYIRQRRNLLQLGASTL